MGRLIGTTTQYSFLPGFNYQDSYTYDAASNRKILTAPDGSTTSYNYALQIGHFTPAMSLKYPCAVLNRATVKRRVVGSSPAECEQRLGYKKNGLLR